MTRLRPSRSHFPYARYAQRAAPCTAWRCRVRRAVRRAVQSHDFWCWFYGILFIAILLLMEVFRCI